MAITLPGEVIPRVLTPGNWRTQHLWKISWEKTVPVATWHSTRGMTIRSYTYLTNGNSGPSVTTKKMQSSSLGTWKGPWMSPAGA